jgi:hypothetical protein
MVSAFASWASIVTPKISERSGCSEAALLTALERFGGWLRVRNPGSMD